MSSDGPASRTASGGPASIFRTIVHLGILRPFLKLFFGMGVEGRENLEGVDQLILVANHNSHLDTAFLFYLLPRRLLSRTHPVAALDYFGRTTILRALAGFLFQPIWVERGKRDPDPLRGMRERLRRGHSVIIFPEGTRGEPGVLGPFRTGVGRLAREFGEVPVVPVFLSGGERALPRTTSLPLPVWARAIIGRPIPPRGSHREITRALAEVVSEMAGSELAGRHRRSYRPTRIPVLAVLGIDGSGKSTLSRLLARELSARGTVCLVSDSVHFFQEGEPREVPSLISERIRAAIGRRAKAAGSLKSYKIPKLVELLLRDHVLGQVKRWYGPDLIVSDGSALLNMTAWARLYREEAPGDGLLSRAMGVMCGAVEGEPAQACFEVFPELKALKRLHLTHLHRPDGVLFLDVDPQVSMERIRHRGEDRQAHETSDKLEKLREGYRSVCRFLEPDWQVPAGTLDGHLPLEEVTEAALVSVRGMGTIPERLLPPELVEDDEEDDSHE